MRRHRKPRGDRAVRDAQRYGGDSDRGPGEDYLTTAWSLYRNGELIGRWGRLEAAQDYAGPRTNPDEDMRELERRAALGDAEAAAALRRMLIRVQGPTPRGEAAHAQAKERHAYRRWLSRLHRNLRRDLERGLGYWCDHAARDAAARGEWAQYPCSHTETIPRYYFVSAAFPGGYPIVYYYPDGDSLCPDCMNELDGVDPLPTMYAVHEEGAPEICSHCGAETESAYGDPYADERQCASCNTTFEADPDDPDQELCPECLDAHFHGHG